MSAVRTCACRAGLFPENQFWTVDGVDMHDDGVQLHRVSDGLPPGPITQIDTTADIDPPDEEHEL